MSSLAVVIDGKTRQLGQRIGKGGEGEIYLLPDDQSLAVKVYTLKELGDREAKVRTMVDGKYAEKAPLVAFPIAEVSRAGSFVGFVMKLVDGYKPLHELYAPGPRKVHFGHADYRFLVRTAANIARAIASVHRSGCVIGDINHSGILISSKAVVALIDADSFQLNTKTVQFLCKVGVPEYTPPELQGKTLAATARTPNHDAFGLAIVIFQLLFMGRHPFVGTVRKGDIPPLHENIQNYRYVYAENRNVGMDQPPGTPSISDFYPPLAAAFENAFSRESTNSRPSAENWVSVLDALEETLGKCTENSLHYIPKGASECAWCEMERQLGTFLFLPFVPTAVISAGRDPGADGFDLAAVWARILQTRATADLRASPKLKASNVSPSEAAKKAKSGKGSNRPLGFVLIVAAVGAFLVAPKAFLLWLLVLCWGVAVLNSKRSTDETPFRTGYIANEQLLAREIGNWHHRNGTTEFLGFFAALEAAREEYERARQEELQEVSSYREKRREAQLCAYLDTFTIESAKLRGIGPATRALLNSFGIDTAADVAERRLLGVPGVGAALLKKLLDWRQKLERQFVYRSDSTAADQAFAIQARARAELKTAPLRAKLMAGPQNLALQANRLRQIVSSEDVLLARAKLHRDQAKCDLDFLGITVPHVPAAPAPPAPRAHGLQSAARPAPASRTVPTPAYHPPAPSPTPSPGFAGAVTCPRCSQSMLKRMARRGRNAGGYFWGCSRYPSCKGTRPI